MSFLFCLVGTHGQEPTVVKEPQNTEVVIGKDIVLECKVEYLPTAPNGMVQWTKGDFALGFDKDVAG